MYRISDERRAEVVAVAHRLGLPAWRPLLLDIALTHASYVNEHPETRPMNGLAWVGARVANVLGALSEVEKHPRAGVLQLGVPTSALTAALEPWVDGALRVGDGLSKRELPQRVRAEAMQAIWGMLWTVGGLDASREYWRRVMGDKVPQPAEDLVGKLQELVQAAGQPTPRYEVVERAEGIEAICLVAGQPVGRGIGRSGKAARQAAADAVLQRVAEDGTLGGLLPG